MCLPFLKKSVSLPRIAAGTPLRCSLTSAWCELKHSSWFIWHPGVVSKNYEPFQQEVNRNPPAFGLGLLWHLLMWDGHTVHTKWVNHLLSLPVSSHLELLERLFSQFIPLFLHLTHTSTHMQKESFRHLSLSPPLALRCVCRQTGAKWLPLSQPPPPHPPTIHPCAPRAPLYLLGFSAASSGYKWMCVSGFMHPTVEKVGMPWIHAGHHQTAQRGQQRRRQCPNCTHARRWLWCKHMLGSFLCSLWHSWRSKVPDSQHLLASLWHLSSEKPGLWLKERL